MYNRLQLTDKTYFIAGCNKSVSSSCANNSNIDGLFCVFEDD